MRTPLSGTGLLLLGFCMVGAILDAGEKLPEKPDEKTVLQNTVRINRRSQNPDAKRVEGITDVDFFAALDLDGEQLKAVKTAVDKKDHDAAWKAWHNYALQRRKGSRTEWHCRS